MMRHLSRAALATLLSIVLVACRSAPPPRELLLVELASEATTLEQALAQQLEPAPGALRFALAFGADADLDLFVTGPLHESVYFANTPSAIGGVLEADLLCGATVPRIESISYPNSPPGRYRVGIDFPKRCDKGDDAVPFAVTVQRAGDAPLAATRGIIYPGEFLAIVLETEVH